LIWAPRVVASPLYLTSEYLIRKPLSGVILGVESARLTDKLADWFTFDKDHKVGLVPTAFIDFGFLPSVGFYFFWDDFLAKKNNLRVQAGTWGPDWLKASITDSIKLSTKSTLSFRVEGSRRQDWRFYGMGPRSLEQNSARFSADTLGASAFLDHEITTALHFHSLVGVRSTTFGNDACCNEPKIAEQVANGVLPALPPGFVDGYTIAYTRMQLTYDTRPARPLPQNGFRLSAFGEPAFNMRRTPGNSWAKYGGTVAGFVDITGHNRVLSLHVTALFADPLTGVGAQIPFTEQVVLGGAEYMRGYLIGRLVDRSAFVTTLQYQWPIWIWLDGTMHVAAGNVFGAGLEDFKPSLLRISSGIGLRTNSSPDNQLELLVGIGTETFADGAKVDSFRLAIGGTHGF
ncbi:MAG: BamA/TamA family outer membrane protein, partial [Polyangiaceae bacterium]